MKKIILEILKYGFWVFMIICFGIVINQRIHGKDPTLFNHTIYVVLTDSMTGTYEVDDIILVKHVDSSKIEKDDVITYHAVEGPAKGMTITHRVVEEPILKDDGKYYFQTKGDKFGATNDPIICEDNVVGRVSTKLYVFTFIYNAFKTPLGFILIFGIATTMLIIYMVVVKDDRKEEVSKNEKGKNLKTSS